MKKGLRPKSGALEVPPLTKSQNCSLMKKGLRLFLVYAEYFIF